MLLLVLAAFVAIAVALAVSGAGPEYLDRGRQLWDSFYDWAGGLLQ